MTVTIIVLDVASRDCRDLIQARGMLVSGQELIRGALREGRDSTSRCCAVKELVDWLRDNRPDYAIEVRP